jgi:hypothetical protein
MDDIKIPKPPTINNKPTPPTEPSLQDLAKPPVKAVEEINIDTSDIDASPERPIMQTKKRKLSLKNVSKKQWIILAIVLLIFASVLVYIFVFKDKDNQTNNVTQNNSQQDQPQEETPPPPPTSPLTGRVLESAELATRPVTGIMIENSPESRPQSGLLQADMVYEAIAEGGVTRFLAVYQESQPDMIGPIRSARPYYVDYIAGLDGSYGHVGGSPEAIQDIKTLGIKDLDQFYNASAYTRVSGRYAPHNVYSDFARLNQLNQSKGYTKSTFTPLARKSDVPQTPTATNIEFILSGPTYNPRFAYDATTNSYLRSQAGAAHKDDTTGKQINPKTVVALVVNKGYDPDGYHTEYTTTGTGKVYVFQDGIVSEGTWAKKERKASLELYDSIGLPMKLNAGQTWITLVSSAEDVRYTAQ